MVNCFEIVQFQFSYFQVEMYVVNQDYVLEDDAESFTDQMYCLISCFLPFVDPSNCQ